MQDFANGRRWFRWTIAFSILHYLCYRVFDAMIFLLAHMPPAVLPLDSLILLLTNMEILFLLVKRTLRWAWPGQTTPAYLEWTLLVLNSLSYGALGAWWKVFLRGR